MTEPVAPARRRRRRRGWRGLVMVAMIAAALVAGVVIWAPWRTPPVLRPARLAAVAATTSSVTFRWAPPASGPPPDKYLVLRGAAVIGTVPGTVTSYRGSGLAPDTAYQYRVAAVRGGMRSPLSRAITVRTAIPPASAARWQGRATADIKIIQGASALRGHGVKGWTESWLAMPTCPAGPCTVRLSGGLNGHLFSATLTRSGAVYRGTTTATIFRCGKASDGVPIRSTLTIQITLTAGQAENRAWVARAWSGRMIIASPYTAASSFYCSAFRLTTSVSGGS